jgi:hypothetical protein
MTDQWRALSPDELNVLPEARLSGQLAVIVWCAAVIALMPVIALLGAVAFTGPAAFMYIAGMVSRGFFGSDLSTRVTTISLIPQSALFVWAVVTALMSFSRSASTPRTSAVLVIIWAALAIFSQILIRQVIAPGSAGIISQFQLLPYILFDIAIAAAYWGYMHDSRAANIYFRRRVRTN